MNNQRTFVASVGIGMVAMYMFDPVLGHRRRSLLRDRMRGTTNDLMDFLDVAVRDLKHRVMGVGGELRYRTRGREVDDNTLRARVAAKMGRYVSHPRAIEIFVDSGVVLLRGHILQHEVNRLRRAIRHVPGVKELRNELMAHSTTENFPSLQGGTEKFGHKPDILQENWAPATRLVCGVAATLSIMGGLRHSRFSNMALVGAGTLLLGRSITNRPLKRVLAEPAESKTFPEISKSAQDVNRSEKVQRVPGPEVEAPVLH